jgi:uncharacterized damage-inducible protein DinB
MLPSEGVDAPVLRMMFDHHTWANLKLLEFCAGLSDEQLDTSAVGGFGSIRATLWHLVNADVSYVERVSGKLPPDPLPRDQFPGFAILTEAVRWSGAELLQLALSAQGDTIVRQRPPRLLLQYKLAGLMVQAINHATEHRAQVATILTQLGLEPPDMSGWGYMEETGDLEEIPETTE